MPDTSNILVCRGEGNGLNVVIGRRFLAEEDSVMRALMPGNAGGAKDPDFRHAFEDGEVRVIGDEPGNAFKDPEPSEEAIR